MPAAKFGVLKYRAVRDWWLSDNHRSRQYVNKQMKRALHIIKWGVGEGMKMPPEIGGLRCISLTVFRAEAHPNLSVSLASLTT